MVGTYIKFVGFFSKIYSRLTASKIHVGNINFSEKCNPNLDNIVKYVNLNIKNTINH